MTIVFSIIVMVLSIVLWAIAIMTFLMRIAFIAPIAIVVEATIMTNGMVVIIKTWLYVSLFVAVIVIATSIFVVVFFVMPVFVVMFLVLFVMPVTTVIVACLPMVLVFIKKIASRDNGSAGDDGNSRVRVPLVLSLSR